MNTDWNQEKQIDPLSVSCPIRVIRVIRDQFFRSSGPLTVGALGFMKPDDNCAPRLIFPRG